MSKRILNTLKILLCFTSTLLQAQSVVNVYAWGGIIPQKVIQEFEHETGILVHFSTYDSNETMYAKLKTSKKTLYDVILPSGYFVERMWKQQMLMPLDHTQLPNLHHLDERFFHGEYDVGNHFSVPIIWGLTGIFYHQVFVHSPPNAWKDLWQKRWRNQLMLLDDLREVFAIALMSLGFDPNDADPKHIKAAYLQLLKLVPNIKLFATDSIQGIMIDEDALIGSAWNGDVFKAQTENNNIRFHYPTDGFVIWVDCLAIPKNAPHKREAYAFINFILKPKVGAQIALAEGHAITNRTSRAFLPKTVSNSHLIYPTQATLKKGHFQRDLDEETLAIYNKYWELFKLAF